MIDWLKTLFSGLGTLIIGLIKELVNEDKGDGGHSTKMTQKPGADSNAEKTQIDGQNENSQNQKSGINSYQNLNINFKFYGDVYDFNDFSKSEIIRQLVEMNEEPEKQTVNTDSTVSVSESSDYGKEAESNSLLNKGVGSAEKYIKDLEVQAQKSRKASFLLGLAYYDGILVERNTNNALNFIQNAAWQGCSEAQSKLAEIYYRGDADPNGPDYEMSLEWYAAISGKTYQDWQNIGMMYLNGLGCTPDFNKAEENFKKSYNDGAGNVFSRDELDHLYEIRERTIESLVSFEKKAKKNDEDSMIQAGFFYLSGGRDFDQNLGKALFFFRKAARKGSVEAKIHLGMMCFDGNFVKRDYNKAAHYFKNVVKAGDELARHPEYAEYIKNAEYHMGVMCLLGLGEKKDQAEAIRWFELAAKQGDVHSQLELGKLYAQWVNPDYDAAIRMLQAAVNQHSPEAMRLLGDLYRFGLGCDKDDDKARNLYSDSASLWDNIGLVRLKETWK